MDEESIVGAHSGPAKTPTGEVGVKLGVDIEAVKKLNTALTDVKNTVKALANELERASAASGALTGSSAGTTGGMVTTGVNSSPGAAPGQSMFGRWGQLMTGPSGTTGLRGLSERLGSGMGGARGGWSPQMMQGMGGVALAAGAAGFIGSQITTSIDNRVDRNRAYALGADQVTVQTKMLTGWSASQVDAYRNMMVGNNGSVMVDPNAMLAFRNQTGLDVSQAGLRQGVASLRALNGFNPSFGTNEALNIYAQQLDPRAANRQFMMMGGLSMLGPGGQARDMSSTMNAWVDMFNLDNRYLNKGARLPGSTQRYNMSLAGISMDMQDQLFNLAESRSTFREKGGRGNFDPSNPEHRKIVGIEDDYATQADETNRRRMQREERMYQDQRDNYAQLEKNTQKMVDLLSNIEGMLEKVIGFRTSNRNWLNIGGRIAQVGGAVMTGVGVATLNPGLIGGGMALSAVGTGAAGDPVDGAPGSSSGGPSNTGSSSKNDAAIMVPFGYSGNGAGSRISLAELKNKPTFKNLSATMQTRLLAMMRDNPDVGIGTGQRANTEAEFRRRYYETTEGNHDRVWNGKFWKLKSGMAAYAPPGSSMHEIGMAADLVGDIAWMNRNAGKYGLKHFAGVNNEPWHVQPAELPNSRREYERGAGVTDSAWTGMDESGTSGGMTVESEHAGLVAAMIGGGGGSDFTGMSISQIVEAYLGRGPMGPSGLPSTRGAIGNTSPSPNSSSSPGTMLGSGATVNGSSLTGEQVAHLAFNAGFRGQDLINMVAIAKRESSWNPRAYNGNLSTGDQSYGLWQINTLNSKNGNMGDYVSDILRSMGREPNFDLLFDPSVNAAVAYRFYQNNGNTLRPWGGYKGQSNTYNTNVAEATQIVTSAGLLQQGDPMDTHSPVNYSRSPRLRTPVSIGTGGAASNTYQYQIDFAPVFQFQGMPQTSELQKLARETASYLREQTEIELKRNE